MDADARAIYSRVGRRDCQPPCSGPAGDEDNGEGWPPAPGCPFGADLQLRRGRSGDTGRGSRAGDRGGTRRRSVLEGDVQTTLDADRLERFGVPVVQVNTDPGFGGECHLDANMVRCGLVALPLQAIDLLIIENVGNLVCPAEFKVGEHSRVMVFAVTEGEDKPLKYPLMFRSAELVLINKSDLLAHLDFDLAPFLRNLNAVNPGV